MKITIDRSLVEQALEALEAIREADTAGATPKMVVEARKMYEPTITALRAALADGDNLSPTEPVAWMWQHRETGRTRLLMPNERTATDVAAAFDVVGPLYLAPPQRKPLTEEEIREMFFAELRALPSYPSAIEELPERLARAIERAYGIT